MANATATPLRRVWLMNGPFQWRPGREGGVPVPSGVGSVGAERGASDGVAFCCFFFLEGVVGGKVSGNEVNGGAGGVFVSCWVAVSLVWLLDTSALAKVGATVESWNARAISSSLFWDLSDVLVSGFMAGRVFFSAYKRILMVSEIVVPVSARRLNRVSA